MVAVLPSLLAYAAVAAAGPLLPRTVTSLDQAATEEAQQRDNTATRAFSNVQIKTSDGRCLFVDKLSGDFRENLTPIQVAACGSTDGQGWDVITSGKHINVANSMLVVSTLTQACFNFDPRRAAGNQVLLFSCGGRADGGGQVTNSQLFTFNGGAGPLALQPENQAGSCLTVKGNALDIATCSSSDPNQSFTFGGAPAAANGGAANDITSTITASTTSKAATTSAAATSTAAAATKAASTTSTTSTTSCTRRTRTVTAGAATTANNDAVSTTLATITSAASASVGGGAETSLVNAGGAAVGTGDAGTILTFNPTTPVPVSGAGGTLNPTAAAEANKRDDTATRAFSNVEIRAPNGQCMFIDPTAGDFRQNLIPVSLVDCSGSPNEKWDVISAGVHNNKANSALIVSTLVQGCISFDGRRATGQTVNLFSCGGRGDGTGETNADQLFPFIGELSFAFAPEGENNKTCILPGDGKLISGACPTDGAQLFSVFP